MPGGRILIGIEDGKSFPPPGQVIPPTLPENVRKRISELTVNVIISLAVCTSENGGQYLEVHIPRSHAPASTTDGRYYMRISDDCKPLVGSDIQRLLDERSAQPWETLTTLGVPVERVDPAKLAAFSSGIRASDRVKPSVKEKDDRELLTHYMLAVNGLLTNLGILCVGGQQDRAMLGTGPVIQFLKGGDPPQYPAHNGTP